eukprot:12408310-Karenia_brevis.AAC.1
MEKRLSKTDFYACRSKWRARGGIVCRHGVFFDIARPCPCLDPAAEKDWSHARHMPAIDRELRHLVTIQFNAATFKRLGVLQAQLKRAYA